MHEKLGIVLAAGNATRMPNKQLLPLTNGEIAIESSINFLRRSGCDQVVCVLSPTGDVILEVLRNRKWDISADGIVPILQPRPTGAIDAIQRCLAFTNKSVLVTFCDNVYDEKERFELWGNPNMHASVRKSKNQDLDTWNPRTDTWGGRNELLTWKFGGWLYIPDRKVLEDDYHGDELIDFMREHKCRGLKCDESWHDIGTIKSYREYLQDDKIHTFDR